MNEKRNIAGGGSELVRLIAPTADTLQWAEERLHLAVEAARLGPWEWDIVSGKVAWSPALEELHGIPVGSFDGTFESWKRDIHPDDLTRVLATVTEVLEKKTGHNLEYRIVQPGGNVRWLEVRSRLQCDADGRPVRMMGVCMDVTERKQVDEVRELFLAILGHDLRNPLQAIQAAAALLLRKGTLHEDLRWPTTMIGQSADRMSRIISDLLDFARGRLGPGIPVTPQPMSMAEVCRRVVAELQVAHPTRALGLEARGATDGGWDPERAAQVVSNLVGNAITHGADPVRVTLTGDDASVQMVVENRGEPIPAEALP
ncbi:MAG TPA: PAS domain-containing protein, partial [Ideonella sp.]|nr:PAS domain-containing protein [Ideonella sp.]